jgi:hypothetical protein
MKFILAVALKLLRKLTDTLLSIASAFASSRTLRHTAMLNLVEEPPSSYSPVTTLVGSMPRATLSKPLKSLFGVSPAPAFTCVMVFSSPGMSPDPNLT